MNCARCTGVEHLYGLDGQAAIDGTVTAMKHDRLQSGRRSRKPTIRQRKAHVPSPGLSTTVGGLAAAAGVTSHVVRYYTRIGLLDPVRDPGNNYKRYNGHHLARLKFIRGAQALGYTLSEIQHIFSHAQDGRSPCPEVRDILSRRISETRERVREFTELEQRMERALRTWGRMEDGTPDGSSVCVLIEATLTGAQHGSGRKPGGDRAGKPGKKRK